MQDMTDTTRRIAKLARPLHWLSTAALGAIPIGLVIAAALGALSEDRLRASYGHFPLPETIAISGWISTLLFGLLSVALVLFILWQMRGLFACYARGDVLGREAAARVQRMGQGLLALAAIRLVADTVNVLVLTLPNPPGQRVLSIGFDTDDLFLLFAAGLLTLVGWAMAEAARVAEENAGFV